MANLTFRKLKTAIYKNKKKTCLLLIKVKNVIIKKSGSNSEYEGIRSFVWDIRMFIMNGLISFLMIVL